MNKDLPKTESNTQPSSLTKEASMLQSPPQPDYNLNQLRFSPLSPQARFKEIPDSFELNAKNFPSKVNVCKGQSPSSINHFSVHSNNSPIVQYYAGLTKSPIKDNLGRYSPEHRNFVEEKPFYQANFQQNQMTHNFNYSPSAIFNSSYHKRSSNSSVEVNNANPKPVPFMSKTLQEKMEGQFQGEESNVTNLVKLNQEGSQSESDEENEDDENSENQELYMLDFNSNEDDDDDEDDEEGKPHAKDKKKKNDNGHHHHQHTHNGFKANEQAISTIPMNTKLNPNNILLPSSSTLKTASNPMIPSGSIMSSSGNSFIPNSNMIGNNFKVNSDDTPLKPMTPVKAKNKFDEANINYTNMNSSKATNGGGIVKSNEEEQENLHLNNPHIIPPCSMNQNANVYYLQQMNNYYSYPKPQIPQRTYDKPQYYPPNPNPKFSKEPSFSYAEDQASFPGDKKQNKKIKRLDPQSYVNQPYEELAKNICFLAKDQGGCRYLQKILEVDPINVTNAIYPAVIGNLLKFINDPFGNYLIQKLFSTLNEAQINDVLLVISKNILDIGINSHGTRVIQQLINHLMTPKLIELFTTIIKPFIVPLLNELNGTHIIQKFCNDYPAYGLTINLIIIENCLALASHRHGCCVLQKYLETFDRELHLKLLDKLIANCLILVIDQFGNYVIQSIFYLGNIKASNAIALKLLDEICFYSKHKYSSNVVEKCFDYCDDATRLMLIEALSIPEAVNDLILDEHGNYVIQKVLACSHFKTQSAMLQYIVPLFNQLQVLPFGEHIISRLLVSYPQLNGKVTGIDIKNFRGGKQGAGGSFNARYIKDSDNSSYQGTGGNNKNYNKNYSKGNNNKKGFEEAYNMNGKQQKYK